MTPQQIEKALALLETRLNSHSRYVLNDVMPLIEEIRRDMDRLWVPDQRFKELEEAVAVIAAAQYKQRTGKDLKVDSRNVRPR